MSKFQVLIIYLTVTHSWAQASAPSSERPFRVTQHGDLMILNTPNGQRVLIGPQDLSEYDHYTFSLSLKDLAPSLQPKPIELSRSKQESRGREEIKQLLDRANQLYFEGKLPEADRHVNSAIFSDRENVRAWIMKGSLMQAIGENELAVRAWQEAKRIEPDNQLLDRLLKGAQ